MTESATDLRGRHAVVTGGSRGVGATIAAALARAGADVTVMGRSAKSLTSREDATDPSARTHVRAIVCDVADPSSVERAFADATAALGPVHILVNNAGQAEAAWFQDMSIESWGRVIGVNLTGTFLCIQQVLPAMLAAESGRIVNVSSTAGLRGFVKVAAYCAAKHGVVGLTRALALETARHGVTVNAVCPGYIDDTDMYRAAVENVMRSTGRTADEARLILSKASPGGQLTTMQDVANEVLRLCSPAASTINGQAIVVPTGDIE